jgi:excisionase family DNA binding protein
MTIESYVSANVVADYLKIERRQVLALAREGKLPAHAVDASATRKLWRFRLSEVDAAISGNIDTGALSRVPDQSNNAPGSPRSRRG